MSTLRIAGRVDANGASSAQSFSLAIQNGNSSFKNSAFDFQVADVG